MAAGKTSRVSRQESKLYINKAEQCRDEASTALKAERYDAVLLNCIHAAISASDGVCVALSGLRSTDPDHMKAADLLEQAAGSIAGSKERAKQLRALLARKNAVEYESRRATAKDAQDALARADRLVSWAKETVANARV